MGSFNDQEFEVLLREAIAALKGGNRQQARRLLGRAARIHGTDARVWVYLSGTTDDVAEQRTYLEKAVAADPSNASARRGLVMLSEKLDKSRVMEEGSSVEVNADDKPAEVQGQAQLCPRCGGRLHFDIETVSIRCENCNYKHGEATEPLAEDTEQVMDYVLPTTRAHLWVETQQRVTCGACGAVTLLPAEQTADHCPYCGSHRFIRSAEMSELIDPQGICLMRVDAKTARLRAKEWLGKGWFSPDELADKEVELEAAYYPFWIFSGTVELPWTGEVNAGNRKNAHWVAISGSEVKFFDNILVNGIRAMGIEDVKSIAPFNLKEMVEFMPENLAGLNALCYDHPMADASLVAREQVVQKMSRTLYNVVEPGREKRNLSGRGGRWSGMTFKHILLPVWVGTYKYKGKSYRVLVNGQTGKVGGSKPQDLGKAAIWVIGGVLSLAIAAGILYLAWILFR